MAPDSTALVILSCQPSSKWMRMPMIASLTSLARSNPPASQPQGLPGVERSSISRARGNSEARDASALSRTGTTLGASSRFLATVWASRHARVSIPLLVDSTTSANLVESRLPGGRSKMNGTCMVNISGVLPESLPSESKDRCIGLLPMSTAVPISSRPWIPSLLGRTISDMSVSMPSKPGPPKRPL